MDLNEFKQQKAPKWGTKIWPFRKEVVELHNLKYSLQSICDFLFSNGIVVTRPTVSSFVKNYKTIEFSQNNMTEQAQKNTENFSSAGPKSFAQQAVKEIDVWDPKSESLLQTNTENSEKKQKIEEMAKKLEGKK